MEVPPKSILLSVAALPNVKLVLLAPTHSKPSTTCASASAALTAAS